MVAKTYSMGLYGMEAFPVQVEARYSRKRIPGQGSGRREKLRL